MFILWFCISTAFIIVNYCNLIWVSYWTLLILLIFYYHSECDCRLVEHVCYLCCAESVRLCWVSREARHFVKTLSTYLDLNRFNFIRADNITSCFYILVIFWQHCNIFCHFDYKMCWSIIRVHCFMEIWFISRCSRVALTGGQTLPTGVSALHVVIVTVDWLCEMNSRPKTLMWGREEVLFERTSILWYLQWMLGRYFLN